VPALFAVRQCTAKTLCRALMHGKPLFLLIFTISFVTNIQFYFKIILNLFSTIVLFNNVFIMLFKKL
jgi:hypothetical protein